MALKLCFLPAEWPFWAGMAFSNNKWNLLVEKVPPVSSRSTTNWTNLDGAGCNRDENRKHVIRIVLERHMDTTWYNYDNEKKHLRLGISRYTRYLSKYNGSWLLLATPLRMVGRLKIRSSSIKLPGTDKYVLVLLMIWWFNNDQKNPSRK